MQYRKILYRLIDIILIYAYFNASWWPKAVVCVCLQKAKLLLIYIKQLNINQSQYLSPILNSLHKKLMIKSFDWGINYQYAINNVACLKSILPYDVVFCCAATVLLLVVVAVVVVEVTVVVDGAGVVNTVLTGPEVMVYVLVNTLFTSTLLLMSRVQRSGHVWEGMVAMHRFTVHWTYICTAQNTQVNVWRELENI